MNCVDAHAHVFTKVSKEFPRETGAHFSADREEPVEKLLDAMMVNGVDQAVLVQFAGRALDHHAYLRYCLKRYTGRFVGIGLIPDGLSDRDSCDHMDRLAAEGDIVGFRMSTLGGPADPLAPMDVRSFDAFPIWRHAAKKDYVLWLNLRPVDAHVVPFLIDAFPKARVVFNHMLACLGEGDTRVESSQFPPLTRYSTMGLHQYENVYVHLSGQYVFSKESWPYRDLTEWHERLHVPKGRMQGFGAHRLLWGSDFPCIMDDPGYGKMMRVVGELLPDLSEHERADIMGGTAKRLLRFPKYPQ